VTLPFPARGGISGERVHPRVGVREVEPDRWLVSFMEHSIGHYDSNAKRFEPTNVILPARRSG